jgi:hypothetical protein
VTTCKQVELEPPSAGQQSEAAPSSEASAAGTNKSADAYMHVDKALLATLLCRGRSASHDIPVKTQLPMKSKV